MRVLMFGWEFPPYKSGGLGTACYGLTKALAEKNVEILFMLPRMEGEDSLNLSKGISLRQASGTRIHWKEDLFDEFIEEKSYNQTRQHIVDIENIEKNTSCLSQTKSNSSFVKEVWQEHLKLYPIKSSLHAYATNESYYDLQKSFTKRYVDNLDSYMYDPCTMPLVFMEHVSKMISQETREELYQVVEKTQKKLQYQQEGEAVLSLHGGYGEDLMTEVFRYSQSVLSLQDEEFDIIHAHEWMTCPAAIVAKNISGKPLVVHIHALESDRSGTNLNREVASIEKAGLEAADRVVTVSHYTKTRITQLYGIDPDKIFVVHNALTREESIAQLNIPLHAPKNEKYVLFMGRITYQKGPEYFVHAAKIVLERLPNTRFIMAGSGDMLPKMVRLVAQMRLGSRFHFTGFLQGEDVDRMYAMSDLYVMPSVSEPFGIAPLEAMSYDTPVIISKQSGVAEVVKNALKVDFWDVEALADKICAVLEYPMLSAEMVKQCRDELKDIRWENAANKLIAVYEDLV